MSTDKARQKKRKDRTDNIKKQFETSAPFIKLKRNARLVFLGLDGAGKTTLMGRLKYDRLIQAVPTGQPTQEEMSLGGTTFIAHDLGGHKQARRIWRDYCFCADGLVFVIDGYNRNRFAEAKRELNGVLSFEELKDVPIAILVNKIDKTDAATEQEVVCFFDLYDLITGKERRNCEELQDKRPLEVFSCSVLKRQGYGRAFTWLSKYIR